MDHLLLVTIAIVGDADFVIRVHFIIRHKRWHVGIINHYMGTIVIFADAGVDPVKR